MKHLLMILLLSVAGQAQTGVPMTTLNKQHSVTTLVPGNGTTVQNTITAITSGTTTAMSNSWGMDYKCGSIGAATVGHWKPLEDAPHDGTIVEVNNTYGVAPTYGIFRFKDGSWAEVAPQKDMGLISERCQFFRPFTGDPDKYVDPTNGAQMKTKYWCDAMRLRYNAKKDVCIP